ncbi:HalOD1 output domain-containing protein [Haladaptatus pallidirubidus]|uniref:HalOD1 output domain-containing protein n=1 Tax=Haladaptatus pallidirubidus TaxID=1008152 RepID=UPI0035E6FDB5
MDRTSYRLEDDDRPSIAVINAIADHEGSSPDEIRPQLYDAVDPDAIRCSNRASMVSSDAAEGPSSRTGAIESLTRVTGGYT